MISCKDVLLGILDTDNISILINYIILLESKYSIYRCKLNKCSFCVRLLVDKFKATFQTERLTVEKKQQTSFLRKKMEAFTSINTTVAVIQTSFFQDSLKDVRAKIF